MKNLFVQQEQRVFFQDFQNILYTILNEIRARFEIVHEIYEFPTPAGKFVRFLFQIFTFSTFKFQELEILKRENLKTRKVET